MNLKTQIAIEHGMDTYGYYIFLRHVELKIELKGPSSGDSSESKHELKSIIS